MALEELHLAFVLLRRLPCLEGSEITALSGLGISLSRIEPIFTGFQFPNHMLLSRTGLIALAPASARPFERLFSILPFLSFGQPSALLDVGSRRPAFVHSREPAAIELSGKRPSYPHAEEPT
jgi:hypothetical protein